MPFQIMAVFIFQIGVIMLTLALLSEENYRILGAGMIPVQIILSRDKKFRRESIGYVQDFCMSTSVHKSPHP